MSSIIHSAIIGLAVADALGVPVEFEDRSKLAAEPVTGIRGYGTYNQPPGTWSDDSSLTFCLADSLCDGYDLADIARKFVAWRKAEIWTPHGDVFDIGMTTQRAIGILAEILASGDLDSLQELHWEADEYTNGNGALMRILPLYFSINELSLEDQFDRIWKVSALTHGHIRSALCCFYYLRFFHQIVNKKTKEEAYTLTNREFSAFLKQKEISYGEQPLFHRILSGNINTLPEEAIASDGYVLHSLEASLWCLLRNSDYPTTILAAINLGEDTDTTAAIVGGWAGALYGLSGIPTPWKEILVKYGEIVALCDRLAAR
jgi:ADP-ribosylglycohydrolase